MEDEKPKGMNVLLTTDEGKTERVWFTLGPKERLTYKLFLKSKTRVENMMKAVKMLQDCVGLRPYSADYTFFNSTEELEDEEIEGLKVKRCYMVKMVCFHTDKDTLADYRRVEGLVRKHLRKLRKLGWGESAKAGQGYSIKMKFPNSKPGVYVELDNKWINDYVNITFHGYKPEGIEAIARKIGTMFSLKPFACGSTEEMRFVDSCRPIE